MSDLETPIIESLIAHLENDEYPDVGVMRSRKDRANRARAELAALRERVAKLEANGEVTCPDCEGRGGDRWNSGNGNVEEQPCELCETRGRIDSARVKEMRSAEIARGMVAQQREILLEAALAKADGMEVAAANVGHCLSCGEYADCDIHSLYNPRLAYRTAREATK